MKQLIIIAAVAFTATCANAQAIVVGPEVVSPAGGYFELASEGLSFSTTVGELIIDTKGAGGIILTQGFQQPEMPSDPTLIQNTQANGVDITVFPNPFNDQFQAVIKLEKNESLVFSLTDLSGKLVTFEKMMPQNGGQAVYTFNTGSLAAGLYNLTVRSESGSFTKTMKLSKVN